MASLTSKIRIVGGGMSGLSCLGFLNCAGFENVKLFNCPRTDSFPGLFAKDHALGLWSPALSALRQISPLIPETWARKGFGAYLGKSGYKNTKGDWLMQAGIDNSVMSDLLLFGSNRTLLQILRESDGIGECIEENKRLIGLKENEDGVVLNFEDGSSEIADFVIGADGIFSSIRAQIGLDSSSLSPLYRGYVVFRGYAFGENFPYSDYAFQTWGEGSRFASVPLANSQTWYATIKLNQDESSYASIFDTAKTDPKGCSLKVKRLLMDKFQNWHNPIARLIENTDEHMISAQPALALPPALWRAFSTPRCSLIGDACHALDPILAQGAGVGIEDAAELVHEMRKAVNNNPVDFRDAYQRYEDKRLGRMKILHAISNLNQTFGMISSPLIVKVRDLVLRALPSNAKTQLFDHVIKMTLSNDSSILQDPFKPLDLYEPSPVKSSFSNQ
jgi:2-polyprenyl-6-methoxyphenol hydroxylase-like FAD-dependent oxidoreductase